MSEKQFYVYVHRYASGPKEGRVFYVGKGKGGRFNSKSGRSRYWNGIVNKYGFHAEILIWFKDETCAFSFAVALIKRYGRDNLCNLTDGGEGLSGYVYTDNHRIGISKSNARRNLSLETRKKIGDAHRGKIISEETRLKASLSLSGENNPNFGKVLSDDIKSKISKSKSIPIKTDCGKYFDNAYKAAEWLRCNGHPKALQCAISKCVRGEHKKAYGYIWMTV